MPLKFTMPGDKAQKKIASPQNNIKTGTNAAHYANSSSATVPITKYAQFAGSAANVTMAQPMFFSPLHTPQNWQIASKRREIYMWARFYYENEPKIGAGVDFYSNFSMNGFTLECPNRKILKYYEKIVRDLGLNHWLKLISHEYFMIGDVFPFTEIECSVCNGSGFKPDGESCNHPGGKIKRVVVLNPDWIEVQDNVLASEPGITLVPDEELRQIVSKREPAAIYRRLPQKLIQLVAAGLPIPLSNRCVSHIKHNASPYGTYGTSLLRRLFTILAYKTKLMTANWIVAERLILPVRVIKIGDKERPATAADIMDVSNQITAVANDPNLTLVTHHAFDYEWYGACNSSDTKALCKSGGWKNYWDIEENDEIMVFDPDSNEMRYEKPEALHIYDFDGRMAEFKGNKIDMCVTPNHKMLGYKRDKKTAYTMEARKFAKIAGTGDSHVRCVADYISDQDIDSVHIAGHDVDIEPFLKFAGYYVAEGYSVFDKSKRAYRLSFSQCPEKNADICDEIDQIMGKLGIKYHKYAYEGRVTTWDILIKEVVKVLKEWFGTNSNNKKIPQFIKNLPPEKLKIFIDSYCNGDASRYFYKTTEAVQCGTNSEHLANDLVEIMFKAGYAPILSPYKKGKQFVVNCNLTDTGKGRFPRIEQKHVKSKYYKGKVWCYTTSTGFFVTMRNGRVAIQGNTGKIHNITAELEQIGKEILDGLMLNQALLNGEMSCHDEETLTLTDDGFKKYFDIDKNDKIACYNPETKMLEYHNFINKNVYDYSGKMIKFKTDKIDILTTPNHRMWVQPRDHTGFRFVEAKDVKRRAKMVGSVNGFDGEYQKTVKIGNEEYSIYDFCKLVGYYLSEGCTSIEKRKNRTKKVSTLTICQSENGKARDNIENLFENMFDTGYKNAKGISIYKPDLALWLKENCGDHSYVKRIPQWMRNLDSSCLQLIFDGLMEGDGSYSQPDDGRKNGSFAYYTSSDQLAEDLEEIAFKCGYTISRAIRTAEQSNKKSKKYYNKTGHEYITRKDQHILYLSKGFKGKFPTLESKKGDLNCNEVSQIDYSGKVYCFEVPHGLFVTKRNERITIQGNSYSSAQVGVETMIRRLESWRTTLAEWVEKHIFLPIAMMQGFVNEKETEEMGETAYLYPTLKWEDLNLRDRSGHLQLMMQLHDKQLISSQKLLQEFDIDYDQEVERLREEQVMTGSAGQMPGAGGGMGGMMGGLGDMGGGMPGGMPGGPEMPGGLPGGPEMPGGMPGGMPMPGGEMGGGADMGGMGAPGAAAGNIPPNFKVGKKGHGGKAPEELKPAPPRFIKLTGLEQKLYRILQGVETSPQLFGQYQVSPPGEKQPFFIDFAYPSLGIGIEADGKTWHENVDSKIRDSQRDQKLANIGWRILRFKEEAIQQQPDAIKEVINQQIVEATKNNKKNLKKSSDGSLIKTANNILTFDNLTKDNLVYNKIRLENDLGFLLLIGQKLDNN